MVHFQFEKYHNDLMAQSGIYLSGESDALHLNCIKQILKANRFRKKRAA
jgi:hypothetical protein